jgi:hypothetical protein
VEPEKKPVRPKATKAIDGALGDQKITTETKMVSAPPELPEELTSRLRRQDAREAHELFKEKAILFATLTATGCVVASSLVALAFSSAPTLQNWAMAALTGTATGYLGWLTGKQAK